MKNSLKHIEKLLRAKLSIQFLNIVDESSFHADHMPHAKEGLTHMLIRIQATELGGLSRIEQHRKLYTILQPVIDSGLHSVRFEIL